MQPILASLIAFVIITCIVLFINTYLVDSIIYDAICGGHHYTQGPNSVLYYSNITNIWYSYKYNDIPVAQGKGTHIWNSKDSNDGIHHLFVVSTLNAGLYKWLLLDGYQEDKAPRIASIVSASYGDDWGLPLSDFNITRSFVLFLHPNSSSNSVHQSSSGTWLTDKQWFNNAKHCYRR